MDESIGNAFSVYKRGLSCLIIRGGLTVALGFAAAFDPNWCLDIFAGHSDGSGSAPPFETEIGRPAKLARKCTVIAGIYTCVWGVLMILAAARGSSEIMRSLATASMVHGVTCLAMGAIENKSNLFLVALPFIILDIGAIVYSTPKIVRVSSRKSLYFHGGAHGLNGMDAPGTSVTRINSHCELKTMAPPGKDPHKDD